MKAKELLKKKKHKTIMGAPPLRVGGPPSRLGHGLRCRLPQRPNGRGQAALRSSDTFQSCLAQEAPRCIST